MRLDTSGLGERGGCLCVYVSVPAMCGHTLIATVLSVPVFALHWWVVAAGTHTHSRACRGSHLMPRGAVQLHLHLRIGGKKNKFQNRNIKQTNMVIKSIQVNDYCGISGPIGDIFANFVNTL